MPDILQEFPIAAEPARVFRAISEPSLLDEWWTLHSSGQANSARGRLAGTLRRADYNLSG